MPDDKNGSFDRNVHGVTNGSGEFHNKAARVQENIQVSSLGLHNSTELKILLKNLRGRLNTAAAGLQQVAGNGNPRVNLDRTEGSGEADSTFNNSSASSNRDRVTTDADGRKVSFNLSNGDVFSAQDNNKAGGSSPGDDGQKSWNFVAEIRWPSTEPHSVGVVGSFNDWNRDAPIMLKKHDDGFATAFEVPGPGKYFYKFVVDGQWVHDAQKPAEPDSFGGYNNVLDVNSR